MEESVQGLIAVIEEVAEGHYSDRILDFTRSPYPEEIRRIAEAVGMMMVKIEAREHLLENLNEELRKLNSQLQISILRSVITIAKALAARDKYTEGHTLRVGAYAERLARRIGLDEDQVERIRVGGILHDIGKIGFSDRVFTHQDVVLPPDMLKEVQTHPSMGVEILRDFNFMGEVTDYVKYHHERMDGKGYPDGLQGDQIPLGAQVISVADCFDAISTDRPYQKGKTKEEAFAILRKLSGASLVPQLVEAFITEVEENGMI